uniref:Myo-inositol oxygenase n=1 Tax=Solanum tuberosum TaxID=4113 RepID=M1A1A4_SOLTU
MTILIEQLPVEIQADETNIHQKELVLVDGFAVPQTNAFGHNFRSLFYFHLL